MKSDEVHSWGREVYSCHGTPVIGPITVSHVAYFQSTIQSEVYPARVRTFVDTLNISGTEHFFK